MNFQPLLSVNHLKTHFFISEGIAKVVDDVSFDLYPGETLGLVGESGCGKSVTALSIMRLVDDPPGRIIGGDILLEGQNLLSLSEREMRKVRGKEISMVFQEPMTSLNPVFTVGNQITEVLTLHQEMGAREGWEKSIEMLKLVGIPSPERRANEYPHQLSGGMRQRVMIAMALACHPKILIADEPTTALDVTIQAQIMDLILELQKRLKTALILITHDLGVVAEVTQRVVVMYLGKVVESSTTSAIFEAPLHPYTQGLIKSIPRLDQRHSDAGRLWEIPGTVPHLLQMPEGCLFGHRCQYRMIRCKEPPMLREKGFHHWVRCWLFGDGHG